MNEYSAALISLAILLVMFIWSVYFSDRYEKSAFKQYLKRHRKSIIIILSLIAFLIMFAHAPSDVPRINSNLDHGIRVGREFAFNLFMPFKGEKNRLMSIAADTALIKINESQLEIVSLQEIYDSIYLHEISYGYLSPLIAPPPDDSEFCMPLLMIETCNNLKIMTFGMSVDGQILNLPGFGRLLFTVAIRYDHPTRNDIAGTMFRKLCNMPFIGYFIPGSGTTGRWKVIDYYYKHGSREYYEWLKTRGKKISQDARKSSLLWVKTVSADTTRMRAYVDSMIFESLMHQVEVENWTMSRLKPQMDYVEGILDKF